MLKAGDWVQSCGPEGVAANEDKIGMSLIPYNVIKEFKHAALCYRFDSSGLWWCYVEDQNTYIIESDGKLEFLINDINQANNSGFYNVQVYVWKKRKINN